MLPVPVLGFCFTRTSVVSVFANASHDYLFYEFLTWVEYSPTPHSLSCSTSSTCGFSFSPMPRTFRCSTSFFRRMFLVRQCLHESEFLFVQIFDGNTSGNRQQILRDFLLLKDYFYAIGFTWIEKVVIDLRILPRQTSPVPTLDWFYSGVTAVLSRLVS